MKIDRIITEFSQEKGSYIYTDFYEKSSTKIALVAKTSEQGEIANRALSKLLGAFQENFHQSQYDPEKQLREAVTEIHWALSAFFHTQKKRFEISLIILMIKNDYLYAIQAGRLVIVSLLNKPNIVGLSVEKLCDSETKIPRIGSPEEDFQFKIYTKKINPSERFLIIPVFASDNILEQCSSHSALSRLIEMLQKKNVNPLLSFSLLQKSGKSFKKRFNLTSSSSARILAAVVLLASLYVLFGRKLMQGWLSSGKEYINEQKMQNINIDQILIPNQSLRFEQEWKWNAPEKITMKPFFDSDRIYLICKNEIFCMKKNTFLLKWNQSVDSKIHNANLLRKNLMLISDSSGKQYLFNTRDGSEIWKKSLSSTSRLGKPSSNTVKTIDYIRDGRLEKNYFIEINTKSLSVYSADNGKEISTLKFHNTIDFISDYDYIEKCFYVTFGIEIIKIKLLIK